MAVVWIRRGSSRYLGVVGVLEFGDLLAVGDGEGERGVKLHVQFLMEAAGLLLVLQ